MAESWSQIVVPPPASCDSCPPPAPIAQLAPALYLRSRLATRVVGGSLAAVS
ncbi:hypothetical protein I79_012574 [Cricetulus griseus]|uniref:Uncharacterized protein n=1 Tax=Cricetulus griseus TaxID=10029 RepID=G3HP68_CRIGR|nr:hypothetical protein I79_012574 [Cricetulus griseus]